MPIFVHITTEDLAKRVMRGGVRPAKLYGPPFHAVFAMPVTPNFQVTHQWARELKRRRGGTMVGIYFRIPESELVWVGRYNEAHTEMTAGQAAAVVMAQDAMTGVEVLVPRRIVPKEILRVRRLPHVLGWRHYPEAHGNRPRACPCCQSGAYGSRKIREKLGDPDD